MKIYTQKINVNNANLNEKKNIVLIWIFIFDITFGK